MELCTTPNARFRIALFVVQGRRSQCSVARMTYRVLMPKDAEGNPSASFEPYIFDFSFNRPAMQERVERAHADGCSLFVVSGQQSALLIKEICAELNIAPVVVCAGVRASVLKKGKRFLNKRMITVSGELDTGEVLAQFLLLFKEYTKKILLPYAPDSMAGDVSMRAKKIQKILEAAGIAVELLPASDAQTIFSAVRSQCGSVDFVLALEPCLTNHVPGLAQFCAENRMLFFGGYGMDSINAGAACAYGGDITSLVTPIVEVIEQILLQGKSIEEIGHQVVPYMRYFVINRPMFLQAGFPEVLLDKLAEREDALVVQRFVDFSEAE